MRTYRNYYKTDYMSDPDSAEWRALITCTVWLYLGFVAASAGLIALASVFSSGGWKPVYALLTFMAAVAGAAFAWKRSWKLMNAAGDPPTISRGPHREAPQSADPLPDRTRATARA